MAKPQLVVLIDSILLASKSKDNLVLCRRANDVFSTALATASVNPSQTQIAPLLGRNVFAWSNEYRVRVNYRHETGALISSQSNAVDIKHGQTSQFKDNVLQPAVTADKPPPATGTGTGTGTSSGDIFSVTDAPHFSTLEVHQKVGASGAFSPMFRYHTIGFASETQISVSNQFALFWTAAQLNQGDDVKVPSRRCEITVTPDAKVMTVRFGYADENKPAPNEEPTWQIEDANSTVQASSPSSGVPKL